MAPGLDRLSFSERRSLALTRTVSARFSRKFEASWATLALIPQLNKLREVFTKNLIVWCLRYNVLSHVNQVNKRHNSGKTGFK
jgi:hypothetical protein